MLNATFPPTSASVASGWYDLWTAHRSEKRRKRALRQTRRTLRGLSDHTLRDIGVSRGEIGGFGPADITRRPW
jgi:uncharacterized protein YjiS (DUF1127 family)